ncbi:MAG: hypothetical protein ACT4OU_04425 [Hyphomicrobium sp.]
MAEVDLDSIRRAFADLTGLFEDAAHIASEAQGAETIEGGRCQFRRISKAMDRIRRRLINLEGRLR